MVRKSRRQICNIEEVVSVVTKKRNEEQKKDYDYYMSHARLHATAVAAIILAGKPRMDEPLSKAWTRTLQHYEIPILPSYEWDRRTRRNNQTTAAQQLLPVIIGNAEEASRFKKIFERAPVWLADIYGRTVRRRLFRI